MTFSSSRKLISFFGLESSTLVSSLVAALCTSSLSSTVAALVISWRFAVGISFSLEAFIDERAFVGNTVGQANGVYDMPLHLRFCDYTNEKSNLKGKYFSAALMSEAKFGGVDMSKVVMSKAYAVGASFKDFTNTVVDRVNFDKPNMQGAVFKNTVL